MSATDKEIKSACLHCGGHLAFPGALLETVIDCPHCGIKTRLALPPRAPRYNIVSEHHNISPRRSIVAVVMWVLIFAIIGMLIFSFTDVRYAFEATPPECSDLVIRFVERGEEKREEKRIEGGEFETNPPIVCFNPRHWLQRDIYTRSCALLQSELKSPGTAKFSPFDQTKISSGYENKYVLYGYVDSQNEFGGIVRQKFFVESQFIPDRNMWRIKNIGFYTGKDY